MTKLPNAKEGAKGAVCSSTNPCGRCRADQVFIRSKRRPGIAHCDIEIRAVDLFAGCGGMTLGLYEAARRSGCHLEVSLAVDSDQEAINIYAANFRAAEVRVADVCTIFNGTVGTPLTPEERTICGTIGELDVLVGGP